MKLTVLGNYGTFPGAGGACSGYLLQAGGTNILIDCGNGVMSRLQKYCRIEKLDAIVLSHLHRDHTSDMHVLKYAVETKQAFGTMDKAIDVYVPKTPGVEYKSLIYKNVYNLSVISDGMEVNIKGLKLIFFKMRHTVESYGMRIKNEGKVLVYTGDTMPNRKIVPMAQNADLFLCEASSLEYMKALSKAPHLTAKEAAEAAKKAKVKKLLLTHFWFEEDRRRYLKEAAAIFPDAALSEEFMCYEI